MSERDAVRVEEIAQQDEVRRALEESGGVAPREAPSVEKSQWAWLGTFLLLLIGFAAVYYLLRLDILTLPGRYGGLATRLTVGAMAIVVVLALGRVVDALVLRRLDDPVSRYNLERVRRVLVGLAVGLIALSILFANWRGRSSRTSGTRSAFRWRTTRISGSSEKR